MSEPAAVLFMPGSAYGPTIVLPLFWDQYDSARRMHQLGLGIRLDTYRFTGAEMHDAPGRLLNDSGLRERLAKGRPRSSNATASAGRLTSSSKLEWRSADDPTS